METYIGKKPLADNPGFSRQWENALDGLDFDIIDAPIVDLIRGMAKLPYCFTLQSCVGHFVFEDGRDVHNLEPLEITKNIFEVKYQIAYLAWCIDNCSDGIKFLNDMESLAGIDPDYIQFGCAEWFWKRQINSYVLQIQPERFKGRDKMIINYQEARHIADVKIRFFNKIGDVLVECFSK